MMADLQLNRRCIQRGHWKSAAPRIRRPRFLYLSSDSGHICACKKLVCYPTNFPILIVGQPPVSLLSYFLIVLTTGRITFQQSLELGEFPLSL